MGFVRLERVAYSILTNVEGECRLFCLKVRTCVEQRPVDFCSSSLLECKGKQASHTATKASCLAQKIVLSLATKPGNPKVRASRTRFLWRATVGHKAETTAREEWETIRKTTEQIGVSQHSLLNNNASTRVPYSHRLYER